MVCIISRPLSFRGTGPWRSVEETPVQPLLFAKVSKRGGVGVALRRGHEVMRDLKNVNACRLARNLMRLGPIVSWAEVRVDMIYAAQEQTRSRDIHCLLDPH